MFTYKLVNPVPPSTAANIILRSDGATIPMDISNTDYQAYLAWVALGNQPTPADEVTL
jgi:hypothetical protein